jgi:hypothetical protein
MQQCRSTSGAVSSRARKSRRSPPPWLLVRIAAGISILFHAVGQAYDDFTQATDDEVRALL